MSEHEREVAEERRVAAEAEREANEAGRRIAEGGADQHVAGNLAPGRVEAEDARVDNELGEAGRVESEAARSVAEEGRVSAEEKRASTRGFYLKIATTIALPLAFIALIPALVGIWMLDNETDARITANREHLEEIDMLAAEGAEAKRALCVFRSDLERRANDTQAFIAEIASGKRSPVPGITEADLSRSLASQRSTLSSLSDLDC